MLTKRYVVEVDGVEPVLHGPYKTEATRTKAARRLRKKQTDADNLFWLDSDGEVGIGSYTNSFFERK